MGLAEALIAALLCDLDGTLLDTLPALRTAYATWMRRHHAVPTDAEFDRLNGVPLPEVVADLARTHAIAEPREDLIRSYVELLETEYLKGATLTPGARELLAEARRRGARIAVVTSAPRPLVRAVLERVDIVGDVLICADDVPTGKPDPAPYREALRRTGAISARAVAIEDSSLGIDAATGAGVRCIGLRFDNGRAWRRAESLVDALPLVCDVLEGKVVCTSGPSVKLRLQAARPLAPDEVRRVDDIWSDAVRSNPSLFDGSILSVARWRHDQGVIVVDAAARTYRELVAQRAGMSLGVRPLGVCGVSLTDGAVLVGRRSPTVTQYPGRWELVPSGTLPQDKADQPEVQLVTELSEEAGVDPAQVLSCEFLGLLEDLGEDAFDLCFRLELGTGDVRGTTAEYSDLQFISAGEARSLSGQEDVSPALVATLDLLESRSER